MAQRMKIGQTYVMRDGKMFPIQCGLLRMRPDFMSNNPHSKALKEGQSEDSDQKPSSEELKDSTETN